MKNNIKQIKKVYKENKYLIENFSWLLTEKVFKLMLNLIVGALVARYLKPEKFGLLAYGIVFVSLFTSFAGLGLESIVVRELSKAKENKDKILGTALFGRALSSFIVFLVILFIIYFILKNDFLTKIVITIISLSIVFQIFESLDYWFQSQILSKYTARIKLVSFFITSFLKLIGIYLKTHLMYFASIITVEVLINNIGIIIYYIKKGNKLTNLKVSIKYLLHLLKYSWPMILTGLLIFIYMRIDQIMIKELLNYKELGYYSVAVRISEIFYFIPGALLSTVFPIFVKIHTNNLKKDFLKKMEYLYKINIWLAIIIAIFCTIFSKRIIIFLYGNEYIEAYKVLIVHCWASIFVFYGIAKTCFIQCEDMQFFSFICTLLGAIANILFNYYFILTIGIIGAALSTLAAHIVSALIIPSFNKRDIINVKLFFKSLFLI